MASCNKSNTTLQKQWLEIKHFLHHISKRCLKAKHLGMWCLEFRNVYTWRLGIWQIVFRFWTCLKKVVQKKCFISNHFCSVESSTHSHESVVWILNPSENFIFVFNIAQNESFFLKNKNKNKTPRPHIKWAKIYTWHYVWFVWWSVLLGSLHNSCRTFEV